MVSTPQEWSHNRSKPWSSPDMVFCEPVEPSHVFDHLIYHLHDLCGFLVERSCDSSNKMDIDLQLGSKISRLWDQFRLQASERGEHIRLQPQDEPVYHNAFTALTVSYFAASWILLSILDLQSSCSQPATLKEHGHCVLQCSSHLERRGIGCGYLRMFFPLCLVALHSPYSDQRTAAHDVLGRWLQNTSFRGISSVAIQRIQSTRG